MLNTIIEAGATALLMGGDKSEGQLLPGVSLRRQPVGRGVWVRRGERPCTVQMALDDHGDGTQPEA